MVGCKYLTEKDSLMWSTVVFGAGLTCSLIMSSEPLNSVSLPFTWKRTRFASIPTTTSGSRHQVMQPDIYESIEHTVRQYHLFRPEVFNKELITVLQRVWQLLFYHKQVITRGFEHAICVTDKIWHLKFNFNKLSIEMLVFLISCICMRMNGSFHSLKSI